MSTPAPGRRVAARRRHRPARGALVGALLVVLAAVLLVTGDLVQAAPEVPPRPRSVPVEQVSASCLGWPKAASSATTTLAAPLPRDAAAAGTSGGKLAVGPVGGRSAERAPGARGELGSLDAPRSGAAISVSATGGAAVGRATFQADRGAGGLALQRCPEPRSRWWFTGGGAALDHRSQLILANVDPGPAVVDVVVQTPDGLADAVGTRGMTIAPGEVRSIDMVEVAPQSDELQVHVDATRGRVVAGLADDFATRPAARPGREWVPAQPEAARELRLAPVPRLAARRTLVISNPSPDREALVEVRVSGASGAFVPTGLEGVRVPAQSVVTEDLGAAVGRASAAVVLRSPVPVTATVRSTRGRDIAYAAAVPLLDGPAAAVLGSGADAEVQLTAGLDPARAAVTAYSSGGKAVGSANLKVPATATATWRPRGRAAYVVVSPVQGRLAGGVSVAGGAGVSQVPLLPLPVMLRQPVVVPVVR